MTASPPHALDTGTRLALERTRLAHERTLMAWIRTATALISFGFTIYKFFEFQSDRGVAVESRAISPRQFALILIGTGLVALLFSTIENRRYMKQLRAEYGIAEWSTSTLVAAIVSVMGLLAFGAALFRG
jgi:putative membrane protein